MLLDADSDSAGSTSCNDGRVCSTSGYIHIVITVYQSITIIVILVDQSVLTIIVAIVDQSIFFYCQYSISEYIYIYIYIYIRVYYRR